MSTSARPEDVSGLATTITDLRVQGHSLDFIAAAVGCSTQKVRAILGRIYEEQFSVRKELVTAAAMKLDWLERKLTKAVEDAGDKFSRKDVEGIIKILERKARLFGLDAPVKVEHKDVEEWTDDELVREAQRLGLPVHVETFHKALPAAAPADDVIDAEVVVRSDDGVDHAE